MSSLGRELDGSGCGSTTGEERGNDPEGDQGEGGDGGERGPARAAGVDGLVEASGGQERGRVGQGVQGDRGQMVPVTRMARYMHMPKPKV